MGTADARHAPLRLADRIAHAGAKLRLLTRRPPLGRQAYDHLDEAGILIHKYGAHLFMDRLLARLEYATRFSRWRSAISLEALA